MNRRATTAPGILLACCSCALALNPSLEANQYAHTAWTDRNGGLWIGTPEGLLHVHQGRTDLFARPDRAHHIEAEITYDERQFRLRIRDDGQGISPEILGEGRAGHYGLPRMRKRASQLGGKLTIWSSDGAGTELELTIAGSIACEKLPDVPAYRCSERVRGDM